MPNPLNDVNSVMSPAVGFELVDISAADHVFTQPTRGISFGGPGTLHVITVDGTDETIPSGALVTASIHPIRVRTVHDDSTATDIIGWW